MHSTDSVRLSVLEFLILVRTHFTVFFDLFGGLLAASNNNKQNEDESPAWTAQMGPEEASTSTRRQLVPQWKKTQRHAQHSKICGLDDDNRRHIRRIFDAPDGFASCAIVGAAGHLRTERLGEVIDNHTFVIRENRSPVGGFEPIVGSKTSLRIMGRASLTDVVKKAKMKGPSAPHCEYPVYMNMGMKDPKLHRLFDQFRNVCNVTLDRKDLDDKDPAVREQWNGYMRLRRETGFNMMSGQWALAIAMRLCPNGTDVYGITHLRSPRPTSTSKYHYFDDSQPDLAADNFSASIRMISSFADSTEGCLRLHVSTEPEPEYAIPLVRYKVDGLVD